MKIADELKQLVERDERGAFTDAELAAAKAAVIASTTMDESAIEAQIAELRRQKKEIEHLDRDWEIESQRYAVTGKFGYARIPSRWGSIVNLVAIIAFGLAWFYVAVSFGAPSIYAVLGVLIVVMGFVTCGYCYYYASAHDEAYERYQRRRAALLAQHDDENSVADGP